MTATLLRAARICTASILFSAAVGAQLPDGFVAKTFAKPPQVTYPTGLAVAPTGEVFVSVDLNSSLDRKADRGRIVRCVDTDGDGVADRFTDFVPKIDSPRGSCFVGDTLFVVHPPRLSAFRDRDGDGVAEEHRVLVERLGFDLTKRGADHTSNGVRMGIDGWLYLAIGDYGMIGARGTDGSTLSLDGGGVVRVRPDGSELELFTANTRNIVDVAVSPRLDVFSRDNTNDGKGWNTRFHHLIQLADMGYPRLYKNFVDEHLPSLADYGGGSGTAAYFLDEPGLPRCVFTGDFTTKKLYVHAMKDVGGTFTTKQAVFFSTQAIDMDVDGRGRIFVCDWKGGGYRFGKAAVGSVTMIHKPGLSKARGFPDLRKASEAQLVAFVASDSAVLRINAQAEIVRRGPSPRLIAGLERRAGDKTAPLHGRVASVFTLKQVVGSGAASSLVALARDDSVREFALRALADRSNELEDVPAKLFVESLRHEDPRIVRQAIIGLARLGNRKHAAALLPLAIPPKSAAAATARAIPHLATKAIVRLRADSECIAALDDEALRPAALRALGELHTEVAVDGVIEHLEDATERVLRHELFAVLCRLYHVDEKRTKWKWWGTRPDDRGPYYTPVAWKQTPKVKAAIERFLGRCGKDEHALAYQTLVRNRIDVPKLSLQGVAFDETLIILDSGKIEPWAIGKLAAAARSKKRDVVLRLRAFRALRDLPGRQALDAQFAVLADWQQNEFEHPRLRLAFEEFVYSTRLLGQHKQLKSGRLKKGPESRVRAMVLLNLAHSPLAKADVRKQLTKLVQQNLSNAAVLHAIGVMEREEYRGAVEAATRSKDRKVKAIAKRTLTRLDIAKKRARSVGAQKLGAMDYARALPILMRTRGDAKAGRAVFARVGCISCHALTQKEPQRGPYLGNVGGKFDRRYLIQSILDPNAVIAQGFQTRWFEKKNGTMHVGFVTKDEGGVLEVRDIAGTVTRIQKTDIGKQGTQAYSIMPPALAAGLTMQELASLLDFLQSRR